MLARSVGVVFYDRAMRRPRKLCLRLGGDLADDEYPRQAAANALGDSMVTGKSPWEVWVDHVTGKAPLLGIGGTVVGVGALPALEDANQ
jgi:hypothetical protein